MHCKKCGKEIASDSKFCQYCGEAQTGETNKKIVIQIPDIEVKTNPKMEKSYKEDFTSALYSCVSFCSNACKQ